MAIGVGAGTVERTGGAADRTRLGAGERRGAGEGERIGVGGRVTTAAGERSGIGEGAGTMVRTVAGRTGAGPVDRTRVGAGGATVVETGPCGGAATVCMTSPSFTMTGVPTDAALKNVSAIPWGIRMQPCDAAYGGT